MNYHNEIMNIQTDVERMNPEPRILYKNGHRDARHAAAEIALKADAEIRKLRALLDETSALCTLQPLNTNLQDLKVRIDRVIRSKL